SATIPSALRSRATSTLGTRQTNHRNPAANNDIMATTAATATRTNASRTSECGGRAGSAAEHLFAAPPLAPDSNTDIGLLPAGYHSAEFDAQATIGDFIRSIPTCGRPSTPTLRP